jgi:hypothetical protein
MINYALLAAFITLNKSGHFFLLIYQYAKIKQASKEKTRNAYNIPDLKVCVDGVLLK